MSAIPEINTLKLVCKKLESANIPYMLTGSFALNIYAIPRMTRDIDIIIELNQANTQKLYSIFQNDFYIEPNAIEEAVHHETMFNIIHDESVYKIDFIIRKNVEYRKVEFARRQKINIDETLIWIVSPEDLIISKLLWIKDFLSEMQMRDISNLLQSIPDLDKNYLQDWIQKLDLKANYDKVKHL